MPIPQITFREFDSEWQEYSFADLATFRKGKGVSKADISEDGKIECIRYGELYTVYDELIDETVSRTNLPEDQLILSKGNEVIIPASGESQLDIAKASCVLRSGIALGGDLNIIEGSFDGVFMAYCLNGKNKLAIARFSQGISVIHLYTSQLKSLKLNLPSLPEQQKIASFLTSVDKRISQLKRKKQLLAQYKKGIMQQIFSQQLRFKPQDDTNYPNWENKSLKSVINLNIDNRGKTPPISQSGIPLIEINAIQGGSIDFEKVSKYVTKETYDSWFRKHISNGDLLFSTVGQTALVALYDGKIKACVAQNIVGLRFNKENVSPLFMNFLLSFWPNRKKFKRIEMGAVQPSVKVSQMVHITFEIPCLEEQTKIANFLSAIDTKITQTQQQIELTQQFKKGLLQQMFV